MEKYIHEQKFQVKYCEADFKDELKTSIALSYMEEVACSSADELGFGYAFVKPKGYAFMVSNLCFECVRPVRLGELVSVQTWPTVPTFVTFGREYVFVGEDGLPIINASSRWCLIDMNTGKILQSKAIDNQDYSTYNTDKALETPFWKIPSFSIEGDCAFSLTIANSEYDHNMHVNNTRYADYCLNCFTLQELENTFVSKFSIAYKKQCKEGETLRFYRKNIAENEYVVQGVNNAEEVVVQAYICFQNKENTLA